MGARFGPDNVNSGPRLPRSGVADGADEDRDPAMGAKVARCAICGMPASQHIVGRWSGNGRTYRLVVCAHCLGADRQPDPDPLTMLR